MKKNIAASKYARVFDENSYHWDNDPEINRNFIQLQQNFANAKLRARGHIFLNEVYDVLGIPRTRDGVVVGWLSNSENGDNFVDFEVVKETSDYILLDFNVDGMIWQLI